MSFRATPLNLKRKADHSVSSLPARAGEGEVTREELGRRDELGAGGTGERFHVPIRPHWLRWPGVAWVGVSVLLAVAGSTSAVLAARTKSQRDASKNHQAFASSATAIASTLQLALQHEQDLVISAGAFVTGDPKATSSQFAQWVKSVSAFQRYPELLGFGHAVIVPASKLSAFAATAVKHPAGALSPDGAFHVSPAGVRPFYCLSVGAAARDAAAVLPAGYDFCAGSARAASISSRDTGKGAYTPIKEGSGNAVSVLIPIYRGGVTPPTQARREATFVGWLGMKVLPSVLLNRALSGHRDMALTFRFRDGSTDVAFRAGRVSGHAQTAVMTLNDGWTVHVVAAMPGAGLLGGSRFLLVAGIALSILFSAVVFMLGTGRDRARQLVELRTTQLRYQALHDGLTGLPNRMLVLDRAEQMLVRARRHQSPVATMYVDVDGFKQVNDTYGHATGDELLKSVAARMRSVVRDVDTVARIGGDEFVVLVEGSTLDAGPELVAERLLEVLRQPYDVECRTGRQLAVTASIGIASGFAVGVDELLANAAVALDEAKGGGGNRFELFQPRMHGAANDRRLMQLDLSEALASDQLFLLYQPTFDLQTGHVTGTESLLRWRHPKLGVVSPADFIPMAEDSGLIVPIGQWVLFTACRQAAVWHERGHRIHMSVNVSGRQLERDDLVDDVGNALIESGLDACMLTLEVTETALMRDAEAAARRLHLLKDLGVRIAIDDFGTGYSSLAYLRQFPVDVLKIDRSFVSGIAASEKDAALVHTLIQLGKALDLQTLAEGIEDEAQLQSLQLEDCDRGQGFLFARPLDVAAADEFLNTMPVQPVTPR